LVEQWSPQVKFMEDEETARSWLRSVAQVADVVPVSEATRRGAVAWATVMEESRTSHGGIDDAVREYIDTIAPEHRPLFLSLHRLIVEAHPDAAVVLSYQIPTYKVGRRRLFLGAWKHGVSIYGWGQGHDAGFSARHPELKTGKGTIQLRSADAARIPDDEFRQLVRAALDD
jgi:uncharacterized protein YdhG (YjbR/CyaY superfamily)